jgi:hypothetical protein
MGERDVVWEHEENLFPGFKCKYCVKKFRGGGATRLKEHLAWKLHKLVYVNYNLRIQNSIDGGSSYHDDDDPFNVLMELTLVDASNPIREWMERARSTVQPELDEESPETDAPIHSSMVTATADPRDLQCHTGS